jgi:hypothetical protein
MPVLAEHQGPRVCDVTLEHLSDGRRQRARVPFLRLSLTRVSPAEALTTLGFDKIDERTLKTCQERVTYEVIACVQRATSSDEAARCKSSIDLRPASARRSPDECDRYVRHVREIVEAGSPPSVAANNMVDAARRECEGWLGADRFNCVMNATTARGGPHAHPEAAHVRYTESGHKSNRAPHAADAESHSCSRPTRKNLEPRFAKAPHDDFMRRSALALLCLWTFASACHPNTNGASADASARPSASTSSRVSAPPSSAGVAFSGVASATAAPFGSVAPPAGSVALADAPDVRVTLPASATAVVKVGQTFGILVPHPDDFLDEWELEGSCPLGEPLTFISRGDIGRELLWKIGDDKIGTHVVKVRLMHRKTRESRPTPTKRASVAVAVVRS